ncbi:MAG: hypothetical protein KAW19_11320 [Candidatus Aminicenantes bacterium]|nr:hypothetical protein [Candidatus Aminicenantes bacterium]
MRVIAEKAPIYAEASIYSYKIETVKKGTVLALFTTGPIKQTWFYVFYHSQRWSSKVTGFIQASLVERISEKPEAVAKENKEKRQEVKKKKASIVSVPPHRAFVLLEVKEKEKKPRVFALLPKITPAPEKIKERKEPVKKEEKTEPVVILPEKIIVQSEIKKQKAEIKKEEKAQVVPPKPKAKKQEIPKKSVPSQKKAKEQQILTERPPTIAEPKQPPKSPLLTMSLGYGPSLGSGIGGFIQLNTRAGFSFHIGTGYYPTSYFYSEYDWVKNRVLYSAGIKYYLPFGNNRIRPYLDLQYGGISIEAVRIVTEIWYYNYTYENIQKTLMGPSLLAGIEIKMGALGLNGALGLSYNTTEWDYLVRDYFLTGDVGLLIYF